MVKIKKNIKSQLKDASGRYQVFDGLLEGLHVVNFDWQCLYINAAVLINSKIGRDEMLGKTIMEIYPGIEKTELFAKMKHCMESRVAYILEDKSPFAGRKDAWFEFSIQPSPEGVFMLSLDITDRRKIKEKEEYIKKLEELDEAKTEFLSVASHQLRTPVGGILWNLEMLLHNELGELPPQVKEVLQETYETDLRVAALVKNLLAVSRIEQKRAVSEPVPTNIVDVLKKVLAIMDAEAQNRKIVLKTEIPDGLPQVMVDPERFYEVMENLYSNAIKYTPEGGTINLKVAKGDSKIVVSVADNGIGIPKEDQEKIFSKFFRASNASKISTEGSGLGLYIASSYAKEWGGKIWFESNLGKGSVFNVSVPVQ